MARANRHFIPGCIWHITHRCHQKEFLLRFAHDRSCFVTWLGEARKRFGLQLLSTGIGFTPIGFEVESTPMETRIGKLRAKYANDVEASAILDQLAGVRPHPSPADDWNGGSTL